MNIYKKIIMIVSCILFSLLALLAAIITDLNDRDFPQAIGSKSRIYLNFAESEITINDTYLKLTELDKELNLGLVKIAPDLDDDGSSEVFISLNHHSLPNQFTWFLGNETGKIVQKNRLANSFPDGVYLVTNDTSHLEEFVDTLQNMGVEVVRRDASVIENLLFVVKEKGFAIAVLASLALITSLALFWLSIKARGRAIRLLNGSPAMEIQWQDLKGFCEALLLSAGIIAVVSTFYIGLFHGFMYIRVFLKVLISLQVAVILCSILIVLIMSFVARPSTAMFATRQPPVKRYRPVAIMIQALTFVLVISSVGSTWSIYKQSSEMAAELAQWKKLSDQVSIVFATNNDEMNRTESMISELVKDAESKELAAFSYTYTKEMWPTVNFHHYSAISFVNEKWLDLITAEIDKSAVENVSKQDVPKELLHEVKEEISVFTKEENVNYLFEQIQLRQPIKGSKLPVMLGGGDSSLYFGDDILFVILPSLHDTYSDSNLTSLISTGNIIFTGVSETQKLLEQHKLDAQSLRSQGITGELHVVYIAEEGILRAQFTAYLAWLQSLSFIMLVVAFTISTAISALITATLKAKRDFPLRLAGNLWMRILQSRILKEIVTGIILIIIVFLIQGADKLGIVLLTSIYGLIIVLISHLFAVNWCFNGVRRRRI